MRLRHPSTASGGRKDLTSYAQAWPWVCARKPLSRRVAIQLIGSPNTQVAEVEQSETCSAPHRTRGRIAPCPFRKQGSALPTEIVGWTAAMILQGVHNIYPKILKKFTFLCCGTF